MSQGHGLGPRGQSVFEHRQADLVVRPGLIRTYQAPSTRHQRSFCGVCGSAVPGLQSGGALLVAPAGSLDGEIDIRPAAHICFASRASWDERLEEIPRMDGLPG
ncbi:GFA family protein [Phenylobacterium aquaticum]|uniref:GFA family protein n=1 Tax=Phenylobacterium aquaticum TaxID=1763816 RepID=UPI0030153735